MKLDRGAFALLVAMSGLLTACSASTDPGSGEDAEEHGRAIKGGSVAVAYPEAALVNMKQGGQIVSACSGAVIAPNVVLTAGHCVYGFDGWDIVAPYADGQTATSANAITYDWQNDGEYVDPTQHDIGLVFLSSPINLQAYPEIATEPLADGAEIVNVGRINNGEFSNTDLFVSQSIPVRDATAEGFPFDYIADEVVEPGDSGGPDLIPGTHVIAAVNSGAGGGTEVLARVDLLATWILDQVAAQGGGGDPADPGQPGEPGDPADPGDPAEPGDPAGDACGGLDYLGACEGDVVAWCEEGAVQSINCAEFGLTCGWAEEAGFYDCVPQG